MTLMAALTALDDNKESVKAAAAEALRNPNALALAAGTILAHAEGEAVAGSGAGKRVQYDVFVANEMIFRALTTDRVAARAPGGAVDSLKVVLPRLLYLAGGAYARASTDEERVAIDRRNTKIRMILKFWRDKLVFDEGTISEMERAFNKDLQQQPQRQQQQQQEHSGHQHHHHHQQQPQEQAQHASGGGAELPDGWVERFDASSGRHYYFNKASAESTWVRPPDKASSHVAPLPPPPGPPPPPPVPQQQQQQQQRQQWPQQQQWAHWQGQQRQQPQTHPPPPPPALAPTSAQAAAYSVAGRVPSAMPSLPLPSAPAPTDCAVGMLPFAMEKARELDASWAPYSALPASAVANARRPADVERGYIAMRLAKFYQAIGIEREPMPLEELGTLRAAGGGAGALKRGTPGLGHGGGGSGGGVGLGGGGTAAAAEQDQYMAYRERCRGIAIRLAKQYRAGLG